LEVAALGLDILSNWLNLIKNYKIDEEKFNKDILRIPTFPAIANINSIKELKIDNFNEKITWNCCNIYSLKINGGGLISSVPNRPFHSLSFDIDKFKPIINYHNSGKNYFNTLGWKLNLPIIDSKTYGRCYKYNNIKFSIANAMPFSKINYSEECEELHEISSKNKMSFGPLIIDYNKKTKNKNIEVYESEEIIIIKNKRYSVAINKNEKIEFDFPFFDTYALLLFPFRFIPIHLNKKSELNFNVIVFKNENSYLGFISSYGINIIYSPGKILIKSEKPYHIIDGNEAESFRSLIENATSFDNDLFEIGNVRIGNASLFVSKYNNNEIEFIALNPSLKDSIVELIPKLETKKMEVCSHLGCYNILESNGLYRIPAPSGCFCKIRLNLGDGLSSLKEKLLRKF
jgi:hypothetical protein